MFKFFFARLLHFPLLLRAGVFRSSFHCTQNEAWHARFLMCVSVDRTLILRVCNKRNFLLYLNSSLAPCVTLSSFDLFDLCLPKKTNRRKCCPNRYMQLRTLACLRNSCSRENRKWSQKQKCLVPALVGGSCPGPSPSLFRSIVVSVVPTLCVPLCIPRVIVDSHDGDTGNGCLNV